MALHFYMKKPMGSMRTEFWTRSSHGLLIWSVSQEAASTIQLCSACSETHTYAFCFMSYIES